MRPLATLLSTLALAAVLPAQFGFRALTTGTGTQVGDGCGFNCADPSNVVLMSAPGGDLLTIQLQGDAGTLAGLLVSVVPGLPPCPGITFGGIGNSLLLDPSPSVTFLVALELSLPPLTTTSCGGTGGSRVLANWVLPAQLQGGTLAFQGFVIAGGAPTFTRSLEVTIL